MVKIFIDEFKYFLVIILAVLIGSSEANGCDLFEGNWIIDNSYPLYDSKACPFIRREFDCIKFGRTNLDYLKYRWQPSNGCVLPRFDGKDFLEKFRGKKIMYIGDSLSLNIYESLLCLFHAAVPQVKYNQVILRENVTVTFLDYGVEIVLFHSNLLVDIEVEKIGRVLKLDSIKDGQIWKNFDLLIFNTWLWYTRRPPGQQWDFVEYNGKILKDMDRVEAFRAGLKTWAKWVETDVDTTKTKVFFQGTSPAHYHGSEWGEPTVNSCLNETTPVNGSTYPSGLPIPVDIVKEELKNMSKPIVNLLDITKLSQLRKDGHPSIYNGNHGLDCTHWCIGGVPDTWNQILYASLL